VAERMGYRPDAFARSLRKRRSHTIGVMIFDISDPFCTLILRGIEKTLTPTKFLPFIMDAYNQRKQFERYLAMMLEHRVEGLIVIANWLFIDIDLLSELERHRVPTILVGSEMRRGPIGSVLVDNELGGYLALQHLCSLGHRDIAFIRGPRQLWDSSRRWDGVLRFAEETGLPLKKKWIVELTGSADPNSGFEEGLSLTRAMLEDNPGFSALMAFDDLTSFGVVRALREAGMLVPEDCSVLGFDDVPYAAISSPSLSTIRQPMEQMGILAVERLLREIHQDENGELQNGLVNLLEPTLVQRESTAAAPKKRSFSSGKRSSAK
jgi:LacI family transcriptional regulator